MGLTLHQGQLEVVIQQLCSPRGLLEPPRQPPLQRPLQKKQEQQRCQAQLQQPAEAAAAVAAAAGVTDALAAGTRVPAKAPASMSVLGVTDRLRAYRASLEEQLTVAVVSSAQGLSGFRAGLPCGDYNSCVPPGSVSAVLHCDTHSMPCIC